MDDRLDNIEGQLEAMTLVLTQVLSHIDDLTALRVGAGLAIEAEVAKQERHSPARDALLGAWQQLLLARAQSLG